MTQNRLKIKQIHSMEAREQKDWEATKVMESASHHSYIKSRGEVSHRAALHPWGGSITSRPGPNRAHDPARYKRWAWTRMARRPQNDEPKTARLHTRKVGHPLKWMTSDAMEQQNLNQVTLLNVTAVRWHYECFKSYPDDKELYKIKWKASFLKMHFWRNGTTKFEWSHTNKCDCRSMALWMLEELPRW